MKEIKLTKEMIALVDDTDYETFGQFKWYAQRAGTHWYAARRNSNQVLVLLHREIMNTPTELVVHHLDGNSLNCQRANMTNCTNAQNVQHSCFNLRGVGWDKVNKKYRSKITVNYKTIHLGRFTTEEAAVKAYNEAAIKYFGENATLSVGASLREDDD